VIRDGSKKRIAGREVVTGDIIILQEGDRVPADATVLTSVNLLTDESLLTGESVPVSKNEWTQIFLFQKVDLLEISICITAGLLSITDFEIFTLVANRSKGELC